MSNKVNIACTIAIVIVHLLLVGVVAASVVTAYACEEDDKVKVEEMFAEGRSQEKDEPKTTDTIAVPSIKEKPAFTNKNEEHSIDVSEMNKPEKSELVESEIEYGVKE